jgi:hypothetical protein
MCPLPSSASHAARRIQGEQTSPLLPRLDIYLTHYVEQLMRELIREHEDLAH